MVDLEIFIRFYISEFVKDNGKKNLLDMTIKFFINFGREQQEIKIKFKFQTCRFVLTEKSVYVTAATAVRVVWEPSRLQHIVPGSGYGYLHHVRSDRGPHSQLSRVGQTGGVPAV